MRIRSLASSAVVLATAGAMALTGCGSSGGSGNKTTGGAQTGGLGNNSSGTTPTAKAFKIGFIGALSGDSAQLGINEKQGAELAISQAADAKKYDFKVTLDAQDSQGDPTQAKPAAATLINDSKVVAVDRPGVLR